MNLLLADLGNTRLKIAACNDGVRGDVVALPHERGDAGFEAALRAALRSTLAAHGAEGVLFSSVAPPALTRRVEAVFTGSALAVERVVVDAGRMDLRLCYANPERFGVDRWLALLGARTAAPGRPLLVAAIGTAATVDVVAADGGHLGGLVAPAPPLMAAALRARAPHLPEPDPDAAAALACDSAAAIAAGCALAVRGLLAEAHALACARLGVAPALLLTGGGAAGLCDTAPDGVLTAATYHPWLVLDGLAVLAAERTGSRGATSR